MFDNNGPVGAINGITDYIIDNAADMTPEVRDRFKEVNKEQALADKLVKGFEYLYRGAKEDLLPNREDALNALGSAALQVNMANLWGKGERAWQVMTWAASQLDNSLTPSDGPDFEPDYWFVQEVLPPPVE